MRAYALIFAFLFAAIPLSGQSTPTEYWRVTPWDYWAATPTYSHMCNPNGHCYSITVAADGHILEYQDNAVYSVTAVLASGVGVLRDYDGVGGLRCFSDLPGSCAPATYPPGFSPTFDFIPVLPAVATTAPTIGAKIYYSNQSLAVNAVNLTTCAVLYIGNVIHSGTHFLLASYDFGPPVGTLQNIYVAEEASGIPIGVLNPMFGQRLERYFFAPGFGRIRQEGWNDPTCDGITPALCLGNYTVPAPAGYSWTPSGPPSVLPVTVEICP